MTRVLPIPGPKHRKATLSGAARAAFADTISFGETRAIAVFDALHAAASTRPEAEVMAKGVAAGDLAWAIDHLAPIVGGQRTLSEDFDSASVVSQPSQGRTPTMILADLEVAAWKAYGLTEMVDGLIAAEIYHAIKYLDYVARYVPVEEVPSPDGMAP